MRKNRRMFDQQYEFSILALDDDRLMTETLQSYFQSAGYRVDIENDPIKAIERVRTKSYDILLLDFLMRPIHGDEVVHQIREFDQDIFIVLLTGHKSMAPPIKTIRELDIQGYYEKSDRFDQLELLIESCAKSIRQMRTIRNYRDGLRNILRQTSNLNCQQSIQDALIKIIEQVCELLSCENCFVYFDFPSIKDANLVNVDWNNLQSFKGTGDFENAEHLARDYYLRYFSEENSITMLSEEKTLLVPLYAEDHKKYGMIAVQYFCEIRNEDKQLFEVYAEQVGIIVNNLLLRSLLLRQNKELNDTYATLRQNYMETIDAMRLMVDAKDFYTRGHSDRVSFYAVKIAEFMGKDQNYIERLRVAGLFHDIGKIGISDWILQKRDRLNEEEYEQIRQHPALGRKILTSITSFHEIIPIIEAHHERYDGRGYPRGIRGVKIPEEARIISVADVFDAMTSKRTYRDSLTLSQAISELIKGKAIQFDGDIVDAFLKILDNPVQLEQQLADAFSEDAITFKRD